jgi:hypothetical protein
MLEREYLRQVRTEGRERFCQNRDCDPASALAKPVEATIQNPRWIEGPDAAMAARARPPVVGLLGLSGVARLRCRIDASATPENCEVVAEAPAGLGFGRGALGLAPRYRLDPGLMAQGAQGETVIVTASFPASEDDSEPFAAPSPRSQKAAALARQFLADGIPLIRKALDGDWRAREAAMTEGMDPAAAADAKSAVQTAIAHAEDHYIEAITATYAALYSESQLAAAYGLTHGPSGQALKDDMDRLAAVTSQVWRYYAQLVATDVHTSFCKAHGCPAPASAAAGRSAPVSPAK